MAYINAILNSFSKPKFHSENSSDPELQIFTPEGTLTRPPAPIRTPPKFNQKFNQNLTSYSPEDDNFSYFLSSEEEGPKDLADYFSDEDEDDSLDNNIQQNQHLAQRIARSPRAIKTIQALEAAIAMFAQNEPEPEYQTSE